MILIFLLVRLFLAHPFTHSTATKPDSTLPQSPAQKLQDALFQLQNDSLVKYGTVAFSIRSVQSGKTVLEVNSARSVMPASTMKLITTSTALAVLGEEYTFSTFLEYDGTLKEGVLQGNLYIRGTGDPTLGSARFEGHPNFAELIHLWAAKIKEAGITQVTGAIVADASLFEENAAPHTWIWGDMGNYYGAAAYGLNVNENLYRVVFQPAKSVGSSAKVVRTEPALPEIAFVNSVTTGAAGSGDQSYIYGAPYANLRFMEGTVPSGVAEFPVKGSLPDPPFLCAFSLSKKLNTLGIQVGAEPTSDRLLHQQGRFSAAKRTLIYTHSSPPLRSIVNQTNFHSLNLHAEALLKTLSVTFFHEGTTVSGAQAIEDFWQKKGVNMGGFFNKDGSGLSPVNSLTAAQMTDILRISANQPYFQAFYESIPVVGVSGTVKNLCKGTAAANNVHAKSGTMERVKSYAGYYTSKSGEIMAFSLIVNNYQKEGNRVGKLMENVLTAMVGL